MYGDHIKKHQELQKSRIYGAIGDTGVAKTEEPALEKGVKGGGSPIGTVKQVGDRYNIKTATGWKYHGMVSGATKSSGTTPGGHVMGHAPKVNEALESDRVATEKMADIGFRFKAFVMFTKRVINGGAKSMIAYGTGGVGKTHTVTQQLIAAGKKEFDAEDMAPGEDSYDYVKITGKMTSPQVYKTLYEHNGKIILFDDCDSVLRDDNSINLFKGALDTSGDGTIAYGTSAGVKGTEDADGESVKLPPRFKFNGRCIFISNLPPDQVKQPLKSRALKVDLTMTKQQTIDRIKEISTHPKTGKMTNLNFKEVPKYTHEQLTKVIDYLDKNKDHIGDLNVRTVGKMLGIHIDAHEIGEGADWERYADQELFSKSEGFDYNGGLMKSRQANIASIYKSMSKERSGEATSSVHIHLDKEQLDEIDGLEKEDVTDSDEGSSQEVKKSEIDELFGELITKADS